MNGLFRIATRTLSLGLIAALSLVGVVIAKGIHPEVLVAFKPVNEGTLLASDFKTAEPPEHFAQAQSTTRLDVSNGIRAALNGGGRPSVLARRSPPGLPAKTSTDNPLPPLPAMPDEGPEVASPNSVVPVFELPAPPDAAGSPQAEVAQATPGTAGGESPAAADVSATPDLQKTTPETNSHFVAQLTAMQEQLNKIAAQQEQSQQSQQSWLESHQLLHQRQLQQKLEGIEAGLRQLQTQAAQAGVPLKGDVDRGTSRSTIIRHGKSGTARSPMAAGATAVVRDVLESLADQSNLNLTLSINVEGDVEMNLQNGTAETAAQALQEATGYVVEKNGQKVHIPPAPAQQYQREVFLPPIIKTPPR